MPKIAFTAEDADEYEDVQLLKDEAASAGLMMEEGITTLSFYKGGDFKAAAEGLRGQFARVVAANPWLAGRLVKAEKGGGGGGVVLRHPKTPSAADIDSLFTATSSAEDNNNSVPSLTSPYVKMCADMYAASSNKKRRRVIVGSGNVSVGKGEPVALLTLSESASERTFCLVFSLSHVVGDGRTYYEILQMLQPGAAVRALTSVRRMHFSEMMRDNCGRNALEWADSTDAACLFTCSMLPAMTGFSKKAKCVAFHLDADRLAAAKSEAVTRGEAAYVSTNDVLTSGFFNACGSRIGMMGMDCRGRLEGIEQDLAGNYVTALVMDEGTFRTPAAVRKMLSSMPYETTMQPLPGCCGWFRGKESAKFAMVTNWSSFAGGLVQFEGSEMVIHLPVQNPAACVFDLMIPFASGPGKVGVICWTVNSDEDGLRKVLPVGECVSRDLFP